MIKNTKLNKFRSCLACSFMLLMSLATLSQAKSIGLTTQDIMNEKISLQLNSRPISEAFKAISNQTKVLFSYSNGQFNPNRIISVNVINTPLHELINLLLLNTDFKWEAKGNIILIHNASSQLNASYQLSSLRVDSFIILKGKVKNINGSPIVGATINIRGKSLGGQTDADGEFLLRNVPRSSIIRISSIGYLSQEIKSGNKSDFYEVTLKEYVASLDETIVIAYNTTSQRLSTSDVGYVNAKDIEKQPVTNPLLALQGKVAGLTIEQSTGISGSGVRVRIRGQNSLETGSDPLYVIDGVPYTSQLMPTLSTVLGNSGNTSPTNAGYGSPLSYLNPADIESISVLKDADATSIYGSRAAAGAILITTKKGKSGPTRFGINVQRGIGKVRNKLKLLDLPQYLQMRREAKLNDNASVHQDDYDINGTWDSTRSTDWQKELLGGTSAYTDIQSSVSGGNDNTQFLIGAGYHKETTIFPGDLSDKKGSVHFSITHSSSNQKLKLQLSGNYLSSYNNLITNDLTSTALRLAPNAPALFNNDGSLNWAPLSTGVSTWTNPLASFFYGKNVVEGSNIVSNLSIGYEILPGLEFKSSIGYTNLQTNEFFSSQLLSQAPEIRPYSVRYAGYNDGYIKTWIVEPQLTYRKDLWIGKIDVLLGSTIQQNRNNQMQLVGLGYNNDLVLEDIKSASSVFVSNTVSAFYKYNAVFSRVSYNVYDKYIFNLTARRDGSSRFGSANRFHNFGSVGAAWLFSNEEIFKTINFLSFGKLRGNYGTTGNDQIGDYRFLSQYESLNNPNPYQGQNGLLPTGLPNPNLEWEKTKKIQIGLDVGFFKDRILINSSYFNHRSSNQLTAYLLPTMAGYGFITRNLPATVQNDGWEFTLNTTNIQTHNFGWTSSFNIGILRNKLISFPGIEKSPYTNSLIVGKSMNLLRLYDYKGVNAVTGLYQFEDHHGSLTSEPDFSNDRTIILEAYPRFSGGFQNSFRYMNFQLDFLFQFVRNKYVIDYSKGIQPGVFSGAANIGNQPSYVLKRWQKNNDNALVQRYSSESPQDINLATNGLNGSNGAYSDGSYIRLKNISLSWQMPIEWARKVKLNDCNLFIHGQNIFIWTKYKGLDPETGNSALPPLKVLTAGIKVNI